jgi:hypothetical protein
MVAGVSPVPGSSGLGTGLGTLAAWLSIVMLVELSRPLLRRR